MMIASNDPRTWYTEFFQIPGVKPIWTEIGHQGILPPDSETFKEFRLLGWEIPDEEEK